MVTLKVGVFDLDGVLTDSKKSTTGCLRFLHMVIGLDEPTDNHLSEICSQPSQRDILLAILRERTSDTSFFIDDIVKWADHVYPYHFAKLAKTIDGAVKTIRSLKSSGLSVAILSNNARKAAENFVEEERLELCVDEILAGNDISNKRDGLLKLIERFSVKPHQMFYVGDTVGDIEASNSLGINSIAVLTGRGKKDELRAVTKNVLPSVAYVTKLINGHAS